MASAVVGTLRILLEANAAKVESEFDKATLKIGQFDKFTQNAGRNLNRMLDSFSGQKIVSEATSMAAAVQKVGGVSALTERELRRVAFTVNEATAKLRAMGAEVPPSIQKLSNEMGHLGNQSVVAGSKLGGLSSAFRVLGPLLPVTSIAGVVTGLVSMAKSTISAADATGDLATKFRISTTAAQQFQFIADQTGTQVEVLAKASRTLAKNIAEGDDSTVGALRSLGLSVSELAAMSPEDQFYAVGRALKNVADEGTQTSLAMELLGGRGAEALGAINSGMDELAKKAPVMNAEIVKALGGLQDDFDNFIAQQKNSFGEWLGLWAVLIREGPQKTLRVYRELTGEINPEIKDITKNLKDQHSSVKDLTMSEEEMARISRELTDSVNRRSGGTRQLTGAQRELVAENHKLIPLTRNLAMVWSLGTWEEFPVTMRDSAAAIQEAVAAMIPLESSVASVAQQFDVQLAPAMRQFEGELNEMGDSAVRNVGKLESAFAGVAQSIVAAIQGGGNILQAAGSQLGLNLANSFVKSFGSNITGVLGNVLGGAINSLIPGLGALLGPLLGKIGSFFKGLFGIDPAIKAARTELEGFQAQLRKGLTDQQRIESGNEQWKMDIIAIRDAFLKVGKSEEEALKTAEALWDTDNPERSKRAMEEIQRVLDQIAREASGVTNEIEDIADAIENIPDRRVNVEVDYTPGEFPTTPGGGPETPEGPAVPPPGFDPASSTLASSNLNFSPVSASAMSGLASTPIAPVSPSPVPLSRTQSVVQNMVLPVLVVDRTESDTLVRATERHMAERGIKGNEFGLREVLTGIIEQVVESKMGLARG